MSLDNFRTDSNSSNSIQFTDHQNSVLNGTVLGDASITMNGANAYYQMTNEHKEYLEYIMSVMPDNMFSEKGLTRDDRGDRVYWKLYSRNFSTLTDKMSVWYDCGNKVLPDGISIYSTTLLHWYICDGHLEKNSYPTITARWADEKSIHEARDAITELVGGCTVSPHDRGGDTEYVLYIPTEFRSQFFDVIGDCPAQAYDYKWR